MHYLLIAKKEITDAFKNKLFIITLVMLMLLTIVSIILGAYQVRVQVEEYNSSVAFLKSLGKTDLPHRTQPEPHRGFKELCQLYWHAGCADCDDAGQPNDCK